MTEQKKESVVELLEQTLPHVPQDLRSKIEQQLYHHDPPKVFPGVALVHHGDHLCIYHKFGKELPTHCFFDRVAWDADIMVTCLQDIQVELLPTVSMPNAER